MSQPTLRTARLKLRSFTLDDVGDVLAYARDEAFGRFVPTVPYPYTLDDAKDFIERALAAKTEQHFAAERHGRVIGAGSVHHFPADGTAAIGYALGERWWGCGLGSEMAQALANYAFDALGVEVLWATTDSANVASSRVLEKLGMRLDGVLRGRRLHRGSRRDECHYSILRDEWERLFPSGG